MLKINKIHDNCVCKLYDPSNNLVCEIDSHIKLLDIRIQIKRKQLEGYYIIWNNKTITINRYGFLDSHPKGFFGLIDKQFNEILDLEKYDYEQYYLTL